MTFEAVHAVWDYFDGPRTGLADYRGRPHYFVCKFDTAAVRVTYDVGALVSESCKNTAQ
jgi:hypothetical protein